MARFEAKVRELWNARQPLTSVELRNPWRSYIQGWWGYFSLAEDRRPILYKERWVRRHMRKWLPAVEGGEEAGSLRCASSLATVAQPWRDG